MEKFTREKRTNLGTGQPYWVYTCSEGSSFQIWSDAEGISFHGESPTIHSREDFTTFAQSVAEAWNEHETLLEKLRAKLKGHH